jgi:hypothetical protein
MANRLAKYIELRPKMNLPGDIEQSFSKAEQIQSLPVAQGRAKYRA